MQHIEIVKNNCLALTGSFETGLKPPDSYGVVTGNFDNQYLSVGCLQWNIGQQSLQPILRQTLLSDPEAVRKAFDFPKGHETFNDLCGIGQAINVRGALAMQIDNKPLPTFKKAFAQLAKSRSFQWAQKDAAEGLFFRALQLCNKFGLRYEIGLAFMFDIIVQNGGFTIARLKKIMSLLASKNILDLSENPTIERSKMSIIIEERVQDSKPEWRADVLARKNCIINSGGIVHGVTYDLKDYRIGFEELS